MSKINFCIILITFLFFLNPISTIAATQEWFIEEIENHKIISELGADTSQYSPFVIKDSDSNFYYMFYCKNTPINNVYRDRVWRAQSLDLINWSNHSVILEGTFGAEDDLSCTPTVFKNFTNNLWYIYYVVANRDTPLDAYIHYATSQSLNAVWQKHGRLNVIPNGLVDTPSVIYTDNKYYLYFIDDGMLYRLESTDALDYKNKRNIYVNYGFCTDGLCGASHGSVTFTGKQYIYTFSKSPVNKYTPPTEIYISSSVDGIVFSKPKKILDAKNSAWHSQFIWTPYVLLNEQSNQLNLFFAGNNYESDFWWGLNAGIGYYKYNAFLKGDLNFDYVVNTSDLMIFTHTLFNNAMQFCTNNCPDWHSCVNNSCKFDGSTNFHPYDLNNDAFINLGDFVELIKLW